MIIMTLITIPGQEMCSTRLVTVTNTLDFKGVRI